MLYEVITLRGGWSRCSVCDEFVHYSCLASGKVSFLKARPRVCKLCRAAQTGAPVSSVVITSYSIHYTKLYEITRNPYVRLRCLSGAPSKDFAPGVIIRSRIVLPVSCSGGDALGRRDGADNVRRIAWTSRGVNPRAACPANGPFSRWNMAAIAASTGNSFKTEVSVRWRWVSGAGLLC